MLHLINKGPKRPFFKKKEKKRKRKKICKLLYFLFVYVYGGRGSQLIGEIGGLKVDR
jgi:hypothetical protein